MPGQMTHLRRICLLALHASALREMGASLRVVSLVSSDPLAASRPLLVGESIRFQPTPKQAQAVAATVAQASLDACDVGGDEVLGECAARSLVALVRQPGIAGPDAVAAPAARVATPCVIDRAEWRPMKGWLRRITIGPRSANDGSD